MAQDVRSRLNGIVTVLNTPFTTDDMIDVSSLAQNINYALRAGVAGFLVPALASEVGKLTEAERAQLVETTLEVVNGQAVVIGGASTTDDAERQRIAAALIAAGCDGILVQLPYTGAASYRRQVHDVAALGPGFLMIQDWDAGGYGLPVEFIAQLFEEVEVFQSLKVEVVPAGVKYSAVREATGGALHIAGGWAVTQMIEALDRGVHTLMPTGLHRTYVRIYRRYIDGQRDEAAALFRRLLPVLAFSNQHLDISIHFFKRLLHQQGMYATDRVRQPILAFDQYHQRIADELIQYAIMMEDEA